MSEEKEALKVFRDAVRVVNLEDLQIKYGIVMPAMAEIYEMYEMS